MNSLESFKSKDKFSNELWEKRGLNSSGQELSNFLNNFFNDLADQLLLNVSKDEVQFKKTFIESLKGIQSVNYDTEEREFICEYYLELAGLTNTNITNELTVWFYGMDITEIMTQNIPEEILRTIDIVCTGCTTHLITEIIEQKTGIPDHAYIVSKCNNCGELNLMEVGPEVKNFKMKNYTIKEQLPKTKYTKEDAHNRLQELRAQN